MNCSKIDKQSKRLLFKTLWIWELWRSIPRSHWFYEILQVSSGSLFL